MVQYYELVCFLHDLNFGAPASIQFAPVEAKNLWTAPCKVCLMKIDNFADSIQATLLPSVTRGWSVFIFDQWELRFSNKWPIMSMEAVKSILCQYRLGLFLSILYFSDSWLSRYRHFGIGCRENRPLLNILQTILIFSPHIFKILYFNLCLKWIISIIS